MPRGSRPFEDLPLFTQVEEEEHGCGCIPMTRPTDLRKVIGIIRRGKGAAALAAMRSSGVTGILERRARRKIGDGELLNNRNLIADILEHMLKGNAATLERAVEIEYEKRVTRFAIARGTFCAPPAYSVHG